MSSNKLNRREFVTGAAAAGVAAPYVPTHSTLADDKPSANDRINLGFIGVGKMGRGHLGRFLGYGDVQVVAVCEIEKMRRENAIKSVNDKYGKGKKSGTYEGCETYTDFRKLLANKNIDAVVIATPDHWHAIPCLQAAAAKKDIYCEKPLTLTIKEGRLIQQATDKHGVIFQTGSQQRSEFGGKFRHAAELVRNGRIGKVKTVRVGVGAPPVWCDLPELEAPKDVDWEMWVGPSIYRGYNEILCPSGIHNHFPKFRLYREYAGGMLADMGAHHFDIAQWALEMDDSGPTMIEPPESGDSGLKFTYANGVEMYHGGRSGCTFEGTEGTLYVDRGKIASSPAGIASGKIDDNDKRVYYSTDHRRNWLDCLRSRKQTICPAAVGHRSASICHLANIGYWLRRPLKWDPKSEQFLGDDEANKLLSREPRKPWSYS